MLGLTDLYTSRSEVPSIGRQPFQGDAMQIEYYGCAKAERSPAPYYVLNKVQHPIKLRNRVLRLPTRYFVRI